MLSLEEVCHLCNHSLEDNSHGFDQNDSYFDADTNDYIHTGSCTYCKICNPRLKELLEKVRNNV